MKTHRPWQPRMSNTPLFNPFSPVTGHGTTLDHLDIVEDEPEDETLEEPSTDEASDRPAVMKRD
jgi:hypothetical protein